MMSVAVSTAAQSVQERIMAADTFLTAPLDRTLENPALAGYRLPVGISELNAGFAQQGGVTRQGYFDAQTYLRTANATIEGHASYHNGFRLNSGIYENANPELLYPYLTADEVGGRLDDEIYSFGGAYNTALADSTWLIGVEGAYTAILECRRRDPRPKNTVGNLEVAVGGARRVADYWIALGASARKYKQTNEISFVSEIGESKIYHTIGMGAQYSRFAGASRNSSYSGSAFGAVANIFPADNTGFFATADFNHFSFDKILTALNRLPLASAAENSFTGQAGWKGTGFSASASVESGLRKGKENIFGEPLGNVYPEIGSLTTFSARHLSVGADAAMCLRNAHSRFDFAIAARYSKKRQKYLGFNNPRIMDVDNLNFVLRASWLRTLSPKVSLQVGAAGTFDPNISASLQGMPEELSFMEAATCVEYDWYKARKASYGVNAGLNIFVSKAIAVGLRLGAGQSFTSTFQNQTNYNASICMIF